MCQSKNHAGTPHFRMRPRKLCPKTHATCSKTHPNSTIRPTLLKTATWGALSSPWLPRQLDRTVQVTPHTTALPSQPPRVFSQSYRPWVVPILVRATKLNAERRRPHAPLHSLCRHHHFSRSRASQRTRSVVTHLDNIRQGLVDHGVAAMLFARTREQTFAL